MFFLFPLQLPRRLPATRKSRTRDFRATWREIHLFHRKHGSPKFRIWKFFKKLRSVEFCRITISLVTLKNIVTVKFHYSNSRYNNNSRYSNIFWADQTLLSLNNAFCYNNIFAIQFRYNNIFGHPQKYCYSKNFVIAKCII